MTKNTTPARPTVASLSAEIAELKALVKAAIASPASAKAASPVGPVKFADTEFGAQQLARQAAKVACAIHPAGACNRRFSPTSRGTASHEPRIIA